MVATRASTGHTLGTNVMLRIGRLGGSETRSLLQTQTQLLRERKTTMSSCAVIA